MIRLLNFGGGILILFSGCEFFTVEIKEKNDNPNVNFSTKIERGNWAHYKAGKLEYEIRGDRIFSSDDFQLLELKNLKIGIVQPDSKILYFFADRGQFNRKTHIAELSGNIRIQMPPDLSLRSGKIIFQAEKEILTIQGGFYGEYRKRRVSGQKLVYRMKEKILRIGNIP